MALKAQKEKKKRKTKTDPHPLQPFPGKWREGGAAFTEMALFALLAPPNHLTPPSVTATAFFSRKQTLCKLLAVKLSPSFDHT